MCPPTHRTERTPCCFTFTSKQWQFAMYLVVIIPRKSQVKEFQSSATRAHQTTDTNLLKRTSLVLMAIPGFVNPKVTSKPSISGIHSTVQTWGGLNPCLGRKWYTPVSMAGRLDTTVQNQWKGSAHPVLQLNWEFGRRERIQEWTALWEGLATQTETKVQRKGSITPSLQTKGMKQLKKIGPKTTTLSLIYYILHELFGEHRSPASISSA